MQVCLNNKTFDVEIIRKPNKNIYMRFKDSHTITVSCSRLVSEREIEKILYKNEDSLLKMVEKKENEEKKEAFFWYLGKPYKKVFDGISKNVFFERD